MGTKRNKVQRSPRHIAEQVSIHGKPTKRGWYDDGGPESGPRGGCNPMIRWGRVELMRGLRGDFYIQWPDTDGSEGDWGLHWYTIDKHSTAAHRLLHRHNMPCFCDLWEGDVYVFNREESCGLPESPDLDAVLHARHLESERKAALNRGRP